MRGANTAMVQLTQSPSSLLSFWDPPTDTEVEVGLPAPMHFQPPPRLWLQEEVPPLRSEEGGPRLCTPAGTVAPFMRHHAPVAPSPATSVETVQSPSVVQYNVLSHCWTSNHRMPLLNGTIRNTYSHLFP